MDSIQRSGEGPRSLHRSPTNQQPDIGVALKTAGNIAAEIAVAANDEDARYHVNLVTISQKTTIRLPKAGQPRANQTRNSRL
jgi:hypothetical protein